MRAVPRDYLVLPSQQRATETADFGRAGLILKVVTEALDERQGDELVVEIVDRPHYFFCVPRGHDLALGVTGRQQAE